MKYFNFLIAIFFTLSFTNLHAQNVGVGTDAPVEFFSVGASSQFRVNASGNLVRINNVQYSFPAVQATSGSVLANDGSGNLSWTKVTTGNISATGTANNTTFLRGDGAWASAGGGISVATLRHVQNSGTGAGGYATPGNWVTLTINDENDPGNIVTLASNQFTLQAGTYFLDGIQYVIAATGNCKIRLRNITDNITTISGSSVSSLDLSVFVSGVFSIASTKTFTVEFIADNNNNNIANFFGLPVSTGEQEVYFTVNIFKLQ